MSDAMASIDLDYLSRERDRHGNIRWYFRRAGRRIRIRETPGTVAFMVAYGAAKAQTEPAAPRRTQPNTFEWLGGLYMASGEFKRLDVRSQKLRASILNTCFAEPFTPGSDARFGQRPVTTLEAKHVKVLRDRKGNLPGAANNRLKYLSSMFTWAVENDRLRINPARDVKPLGYESDGFHTWAIDEIRQFTAHHPLGPKRIWRSRSCSTPARGAATLSISAVSMCAAVSCASSRARRSTCARLPWSSTCSRP